MLSSLKNSKLQTEPFTHVVIESFASDDEYRDVKELFSNAVLKPYRHKDSYGKRHVAYIKHDNKTEHEISEKLYDMLDSREFRTELKESLELDDDKIFNTRLEIQIIVDKRGYKISPHCDKNKYLTLLLYCPDDESYAEYGTELYDTSHNLIKKVKYLPNTAVLFHPVNGLTWHGVSQIKKDITRKSLQIFYKFMRNL